MFTKPIRVFVPSERESFRYVPVSQVAKVFQRGKGVSIDLRSAAYNFKLSTDQGIVNARYHYAMCLRQGCGLQRDLSRVIQDFEVSTDLGSPNGQFVVGWMAEHAIRIPVDFVVAV